jgi:glycosyltransferase involved in cell wall biosynthesis
MRIAFISTMQEAQWGGSEELWSQTASRLKQQGHEVMASVPHRSRLSERVTALEQQGILLRTHPSDHSARALRIWHRLSRESRKCYERLKRFHPDLAVISQGFNAGGLEWAEAFREAAVPYVMIVHCNCEHWWFQDKFDQAVASYTAARKVFCVSHKNLDLLRLQISQPLPNAEVIRNPFNVSPDNALAWPDDSGTWRMACVARLFLAAKGQDLLLQTLACSEWRDRPVELNLYGTGIDEKALRRMAEAFDLKSVHFRGYVNDVASIWKQNHLLVLPSRFEGLPLALVEAMWCSRPAVVTDIGGNAELCIDGQTGFVAPYPSVESFSQAMERAWERRGNWAQMGQAARAAVENAVPKDAVSVFCDRLRACVAATTGAAPPRQ